MWNLSRETTKLNIFKKLITILQVRIRTIDKKDVQAFDKENLGNGLHDKEVKEATQKVEDAVKKQLKDAGVNLKCKHVINLYFVSVWQLSEIYVQRLVIIMFCTYQ